MITLYGIRNCDTVKKARKWLEDRHIDYRFHDFREDGLSESQVRAWLEDMDRSQLVNKRSTSWKALDSETREAMSAETAVDAIMQHPTLIKRPLLDTGKQRFTGFSIDDYERIFSHHTL